MAKPVLVVVDDEDTTLQALAGELESRYGVHYQVVSSSSAEMALARLAELKAAGADVPLVLADQQMPGMTGTQLLARVRQFFPTARRGLLISWGNRPLWWAAATQPGKPRCICRNTRSRSRFSSARGLWRRACPTT
jgi:thioredoxin reductase (NADPH)